MLAELNYLIDGPLVGIAIMLFVWVVAMIVNRLLGK